MVILMMTNKIYVCMYHFNDHHDDVRSDAGPAPIQILLMMMMMMTIPHIVIIVIIIIIIRFDQTLALHPFRSLSTQRN